MEKAVFYDEMKIIYRYTFSEGSYQKFPVRTWICLIIWNLPSPMGAR
jgi:hypothetical protein